jgi:hypothetical protein
LLKFQRGSVWNRDQVRGLFDALYRRHLVSGLLVWATESRTATHHSDAPLAAGVVKLLLDGQQRMTTLYGGETREPVAVLLNENTAALAFANSAGFRCFTTALNFRDYVQQEMLADRDSQAPLATVAQSVSLNFSRFVAG